MPIPTNKILVLLLMSALLLLPSDGYPVMLGVFGLYVGLIILLAIIDYFLIRANLKLEIQRKTEKQLSLLDKNDVEIEISHRGKFPLKIQMMEVGLDRFLVSPLILRTSIQPGSRKTLVYSLTPADRGDFEFKSINMRVKSPLGFIILQRKYPLRDKIKVVPSIKAIKKYNLLSRHPLGIYGEKQSKIIGRSTNFKELRDYIAGDEYRSIDWKSTARRNKLTVRVYGEERSQNLIIMVDTGRLMTATVPENPSEFGSDDITEFDYEMLTHPENRLLESTRLDYTINASMVLSYVALSRGDRVGLIAFSDREEVNLPPKSGKSQITRIVNTLYGLKPKLIESDYRRALLKAAKMLRKRSLIVFFTDLIDPESSRELIRYIKSLYPTHTTLVIAFRDSEIVERSNRIPTTQSDIYEIAIARDILYQRRLAMRELNRSGALTLDLAPSELTIGVVSEYLRLKSTAGF